MALRWDLSRIEDADNVCWITAPEDIPMHAVKAGDQVMNPVTNALIWATMAVDLGEISEKNADEFFARLRFTERLDGPMLIRAEVDGKRPEGAAAFITPQEVLAHVGLSCNVTAKSRANWLKRFDIDLDRLVFSFEKARDEIAA